MAKAKKQQAAPPTAKQAARQTAKQTYKTEKKEFKQAIKATPKQAPKNAEKAATKAAAFQTAKSEFKAAKQGVKAAAPGFKKGKLGTATSFSKQQDERKANRTHSPNPVTMRGGKPLGKGRVQVGGGSGMMGYLDVLTAEKANKKVPKWTRGMKFGPASGVERGQIRVSVGKGGHKKPDKDKKPIATAPVKPVTPTTPVKPVTPTGPTKPVVPVKPPTGPTGPVAGKPVQGKPAKPFDWTKKQGSGGGGNIAQGGAQGIQHVASGPITGSAGMAENKKGGNKYRFI